FKMRAPFRFPCNFLPARMRNGRPVPGTNSLRVALILFRPRAPPAHHPARQKTPSPRSDSRRQNSTRDNSCGLDSIRSSPAPESACRTGRRDCAWASTKILWASRTSLLLVSCCCFEEFETGSLSQRSFCRRRCYRLSSCHLHDNLCASIRQLFKKFLLRFRTDGRYGRMGGIRFAQMNGRNVVSINFLPTIEVIEQLGCRALCAHQGRLDLVLLEKAKQV